MKKEHGFSKITKKSGIKSLIQSLKDKNSFVVGWKVVNGRKKTVPITLRVLKFFRDEIILRANTIKDLNRFKELSSGPVFNIFCEEDLTLFQAQILSRNYTDLEITIKLPKFIAIIDRRKSLRYELVEDENILIEMQKKLHLINCPIKNFSKSAFDISKGGISFLISKSEKQFFRVGDDSIELKFHILGKKLMCKGEILNITQLVPSTDNDLNYMVYKIALEFFDLSLEDQNFINSYILDRFDFNKAV